MVSEPWTLDNVPARRLSPEVGWTRGGVPTKMLDPENEWIGGSHEWVEP